MKRMCWEDSVFDRFALPRSLQTEVVGAGEILGELDPTIADWYGVPSFPVIAPAVPALLPYAKGQIETPKGILAVSYSFWEGKLTLTIAIGCTGGRHRSVALASALNDYFHAHEIDSVNINRDIDK